MGEARIEPEALFGELAPLGAALVELGVGEDIAAAFAAAAGVVLEELHLVPAGRADDVEDVPGLPEGRVLAGAHGDGHGLPLFASDGDLPLQGLAVWGEDPALEGDVGAAGAGQAGLGQAPQAPAAGHAHDGEPKLPDLGGGGQYHPDFYLVEGLVVKLGAAQHKRPAASQKLSEAVGGGGHAVGREDEHLGVELGGLGWHEGQLDGPVGQAPAGGRGGPWAEPLGCAGRGRDYWPSWRCRGDGGAGSLAGGHSSRRPLAHDGHGRLVVERYGLPVDDLKGPLGAVGQAVPQAVAEAVREDGLAAGDRDGPLGAVGEALAAAVAALGIYPGDLARLRGTGAGASPA